MLLQQGTDKEEGMNIGKIKFRILLSAVCAVFFLFASVGINKYIKHL